MPAILTFAMAAPMASMGDLAVGERRPTADRPPRSAILGLLAACLGIERADENGHRDLAAGLAIGLALLDQGPLLIDYHTAQAPSRARGVRHPTRASELAELRGLNTVQTWREYWSDVLVLVALAFRAGASRTPGDLASALRQPRFVPCFGRKSCPLSLPMEPRVAEAEDIVAALLGRIASGPELDPRQRLWHAGSTREGAVLLFVDPEDLPPVLPNGVIHLRTDIRRDRVVSRRRWQFDLRGEAVLRVDPAA